MRSCTWDAKVAKLAPGLARTVPSWRWKTTEVALDDVPIASAAMLSGRRTWTGVFFHSRDVQKAIARILP